jgi:large-conductance mechanosensitive channel
MPQSDVCLAVISLKESSMDVGQLIKDISNALIYVWLILFFVVRYFSEIKRAGKKKSISLKKKVLDVERLK